MLHDMKRLNGIIRDIYKGYSLSDISHMYDGFENAGDVAFMLRKHGTSVSAIREEYTSEYAFA